MNMVDKINKQTDIKQIKRLRETVSIKMNKRNILFIFERKTKAQILINNSMF